MKMFGFKGGSLGLDLVRFSSSWILPPSILCILRASFSLYIFACIITFLVMDGEISPHVAGHYFSYFTSLTFFGLAFYFAFSALHTGTYWLTGTPLLARWPRFLQTMHSIFYTTITMYPFLVTIVYWVLIYNGFENKTDTWRQISQHALNSVFALFEIFIPRTLTAPFLHIIPLIIILGGYLGIAYLTYHDSKFYVYDFLDETKHSKGVVAGYILGILAGTIVVFLLIHFLLTFRRWLTEEKFGMRGKFSKRAVRTLNDAEMEAHGKDYAMVQQQQLH